MVIPPGWGDSLEVLTALAAQGDGQVREVMESAHQQAIGDAGVLPGTFDA